MRVTGKRVLVTGAASGIGAASARRFAEEGAHVAMVDVDADSGAALAAELNGGSSQVQFHRADVADPAGVADIVAQVAEELGGIDVLHSNAGMAAGSSGLGTDIADWDRVHALNLRAPWLWSKEVLPHLLRSGTGAIVFTGSTSGMVGYPGAIAYTSSKGGLLNLTRSLALELAEQGVTVNAVCPGHIDTPMTRGFFASPDGPDALRARLQEHAETVPMKRLGRPEEVAAFVVFLASDDARFCTGGIYPCDGGMTAA